MPLCFFVFLPKTKSKTMPPNNLGPSAKPDAAYIDLGWKYVGRLPPDNYVRRIAEDLMRGTLPEDVLSVTFALYQDITWKWNEKQLAVWCLGAIPLDEASQKSAYYALNRVLTKYKPRILDYRLVFRGCCMFIPIVFTVFIAIVISFPHLAASVVFAESNATMLFLLSIIFFSLLLMPPIASLYDFLRKRTLRYMTFTSLTRLYCLECIAPVSAGLFERDKRIRELAYQWLHHKLPTVKPEHFELLDSTTISSLANVLNHPDHELLLKTLQAIEYIGTGASIPQVRKIAYRGQSTELKAAAEKTLAVLYKRAEEQKRKATLLRPSKNPNEPSATLLRPAQDSDIDTAQLLRIPDSD
ncbi:MAG: hypothetical protein ABJA67_11655 [Chthonomonadales bacterium]